MKALRTVVDQLVERRLWPLVVILVAGIVAVPLVVAKPRAGAPSTPAAAPSSSTPSASVAAADVVAPDPTVVSDTGSGRGLESAERHDPFVQRGIEKPGEGEPAAGSGSSGSSPAPTTTTSPESSASTGSSTSNEDSTSTGAPAQTTPETTAPTTVYVQTSVNVAFGRVGRQRPHRGLPRLTPLPGPANPVVIFLGLVPGTKTAVFLISSDAHPDGDGSCRPSRKSCQTVHLEPGQREFFDIADASGKVVEYQLDYTRASRRRVATRAEAERSEIRGRRRGGSSTSSPPAATGGKGRKARGASHRAAATAGAGDDVASVAPAP